MISPVTTLVVATLFAEAPPVLSSRRIAPAFCVSDQASSGAQRIRRGEGRFVPRASWAGL